MPIDSVREKVIYSKQFSFLSNFLCDCTLKCIQVRGCLKAYLMLHIFYQKSISSLNQKMFNIKNSLIKIYWFTIMSDVFVFLKLKKILKGPEHDFRFYFFLCFMLKMVNLRILNDWPKFERFKSSYKRDTEVRNHCYWTKLMSYIHLQIMFSMELLLRWQNDLWQTM